MAYPHSEALSARWSDHLLVVAVNTESCRSSFLLLHEGHAMTMLP